MAEPLRFRVQMIGFGESPILEPSPSGIILEIEWLTTPASVRQVPLSRADFAVYGDAQIGAMQSQDIYWLNLEVPDASPLPALLRAVRDGQTYDP
jgi:hypothetical protein